MQNFLHNQWIIGIGAGIVSGIIVFFITRWFLRRKDKSAYIKLIESANAEIISTLKPYVAEKGLPEQAVVNAIILSVARKYKVSSDELFSIRIICEELIREIIGNAYVSSNRKDEYSIQLINYLNNLDAQRDKTQIVSDYENEITNKNNAIKQAYFRRFSLAVSTIISISVALMITLITSLKDTEFYFISQDGELSSTFIIMYSISASLVFMFILLRLIIKRKE